MAARASTTVAVPVTVAVTTAPPASTAAPTTSSSPPPVTTPLPDGVRWCGYVPGSPTAPEHADITPAPAVAFVPPAPTAVAAATTAAQLAVLDQLSGIVTADYVDPLLSGTDWPAIVDRYRGFVQGGLSDDDFHVAMNGLIGELGDEHSHLESPADIAAAEAELAGQIDYVGVGGYFQPIPEAGGASVILVFHASPAEGAGLRAHDTVLAVDGASPLPVAGQVWHNPFLGPEGSTVSLTVAHPGSAPETLTLTRARVAGAKPLDVCMVPGTRIVSVLLPGLFDTTLPTQLETALTALAGGGPLDGVVIDNRMNTGGSSNVLEPILSLFTQGQVGEYRSRRLTRPLAIAPNDVNGSQTVPLVVLVGTNTISYGETMSGILQATGRARVIGQTTLGNVETLDSFDLDDGSRLWLAAETFAATGATYGPWEQTGIIPDVNVPTRWDLFDETDDPALAAAVDLLVAG